MKKSKMNLVMDMVHDNPGEAPFQTAFRKPEKLIEYGFNTQVYKYFDTTVPFSTLEEDFFDTADAKKWLGDKQKEATEKMTAAHEAGLLTMCHVDLFVLPKKLVEKYRNDLCDENGRISIFKEKTKEIHRVLFDELFAMYPLDGLIIRVGETYLHDTPYHAGNGAVFYGDTVKEKESFVELIRFLREELCEKRDKYLIFRTWDRYPDCFHANALYYLDITNRIDVHEKLIFSIKHTALDFWRRVKFNPCIGEGKHFQVVEVQCQREYEGKGAYPMYNMGGVIHSFSEMKDPKGLKDFMGHPLMRGIYTWSRGGGWYGPYLQNEFWCDLNAYVAGMYGANPNRTEKEIFLEYAQKKMGMDPENAERFYSLCCKVPEAVLRGRYTEAYDLHLNEGIMPSMNWLRDDRMSGEIKLNPVFEYLEDNHLVEDALREKDFAVTLWTEIRDDFQNIQMNDIALRAFIENSIEYGLRLFTIVRLVFYIFARYRKKEGTKDLLDVYDRAWSHYRELESRPQASTSFFETFRSQTPKKGLGWNDVVEYCREHLYY